VENVPTGIRSSDSPAHIESLYQLSYPGPPRNPRTKRIFWALEMGLIGCPETSARNYHYKLRNIPEERRFTVQICLCNIQQRVEIKKKDNFPILRTSLVSWRSFLVDMYQNFQGTCRHIFRVVSCNLKMTAVVCCEPQSHAMAQWFSRCLLTPEDRV
jgi:hypothetical protein